MMRIPVLRVCAVVVLVGLVWSIVALPQSVSAASATAAAAFDLRESPAAEAPVVAVVPAGAPLSLDGPPQGAFYPVTYEGTFGWAPATGLVVTKDDPAAPVIEDAAAEPTPTIVPAVEASVPPADPVQPVVEAAAPTTEPAPPTPETAAPATVPASSTAEPAVATVAAPSLVATAPPPSITTEAPAAPSATPVETATATVAPTVTGVPTAPVATAATLPSITADPAPAVAPAEVPATATATAVETVVPLSSLTADLVSTAEPVQTEVASPAAAPSPAVAPSPTAEPTATPRPVVRGPATATVNTPLVAQPIGGAETLFTVPAGSTVTRMGSYVNGYVSVDFMGIVGWVDFALLAEPLASEPEPVIESTPVPTASATATPRGRRESTEPTGVGGPGSGEAYTADRLSLRSGPNAAYPELSRIPAGEPVALTGVMESGFVRVEYGGEIGWVSMSALGMPPDPTPETARRGTASPRVYSREEIVQVIYAAADRYDQPRADMLRVAECESSLDPYAVNASGSYGLFQFVASTWETTPYANKDIFDPSANANAAAWMWSVGRRNEWVCQ